MKNQKIIKTNGLPSLKQISDPERQSIVIFDQYLLKNSSFKKWISDFELAIPVKAGESLKTLQQYAKTLNLLQKWQNQNKINKKIQFVAIGGGSVGDFVGFLASTYQRGCPWVCVPSTWLAAIDSSHGGKTGLNLNKVKNQIGTFWPARKIILSKQILLNQSEDRLSEAFGELIKISYINQPQLLEKINFTNQYVWKNLEAAIAGKMQIVDQDPFEKTGVRHLLNLGHTMAHVYEAELGLSHGRAVLMGLLFSARWSYHLGFMSQNDFLNITKIIMEVPNSDKDYLKINKLSSVKFKNLLNQDKKMISAKKQKTLRFILMIKPGLVFVAQKTVNEIVDEFERQRFNA